MPTIEQYSVAPRPIEMFFQGTFLSLGTGFVWRIGSSHYLITNWHNLAGKDPRTGKHLSRTNAEPSHIRIWWNVAGNLATKSPNEVPIRNAEGKPLWWIHPTYGNRVDVVALPVITPPNTDAHPINDMPTKQIEMLVGQDVFILGYPFGIGPGGFPIWKRASLATEPGVIDAADPHILVDTASRPGMSGSPVIRHAWNTVPIEGGGVEMMLGSATRLVGVYSGRLATNNEKDAQLGMVWPAALITEIISSGLVDS